MRDSIRQKDLELPWRILDKLINDYIEGRLGGGPAIEMVAVLEIDSEGGKLAGPTTDRPEQVPNPRGSILGRVISNAADKDTPDTSLGVFWPFNQHEVMPIKEGEAVIVIYLDEAKTHGLWLTRCPEPNKVHNLNFTALTKRFREDDENELGAEESATAHQAVQDLEEDPGIPTVDPNFTNEEDSVPELLCRAGDRVIHGSSNSAIILSRDRVDTADSGQTDGAGTIDLVVGREAEDLSMSVDSARVYISANTNADENFEIGNFEEDVTGVSFVVAKADEIRLIARGGIKLIVEDGPTSIVMQGGKVTVTTPGEVKIDTDDNVIVEAGGDIVLDSEGSVLVGSAGASEPLVKGNALESYLNDVFKIYNAMVIDVATIPGIGQANSSIGTAVGQVPFAPVKSDSNKVE